MDLSAAEQLNGKRWKLAKLGAFICFGVACGLLGASLMLSQPGSSAGDIGSGSAVAARTY
jgi:hypothetical protein